MPVGGSRLVRIQSDPEKGWFTLRRRYRPLSFFDKTWQPSEIELVQ